MNIITVVYKGDKRNLYYQAKSLAKNWKGKKEWIIVCEDGLATESFVKETIIPIMQGWNVVVPKPPTLKTANGWWRQQIFKLWSASTINTEDYSLILDAKNFLINPIDESWFFVGEAHKVRIFNVGPNIDREPSDSWRQCCAFFGGDPYKKIEGWNLTPWVWRKDLVRLTIQKYLDHGFNIYDTIDAMPAWEFNAYWFFAQDIYTWEHHDMGDGIYEGIDSYGKVIEHADHSLLAHYRVMPFWTFHRRMDHAEEALAFSNGVLKDKGIIDDNDIAIWEND